MLVRCMKCIVITTLVNTNLINKRSVVCSEARFHNALVRSTFVTCSYRRSMIHRVRCFAMCPGVW